MTEWISVRDKLPDHEGKVLVTSDGLVGFTSFNIRKQQWETNFGVFINIYDQKCDYGIECTADEITHWMPLPKEPND